MIKGFKTSEFILIAAVFLFAVSIAKGWLTPGKVQDATAAVQQTTEAVPALIAAVKDLIASLGPLAGMAGLAWAYLRRRTKIKLAEDAVRAEQARADAEIAKVAAQKEVALAKLSQPEKS